MRHTLRRITMGRIKLIFFFLIVSAGVTLLTSALYFDRSPRSCLAAMLAGSAHRPFVLRRLVPDVLNIAVQTIPTEWQMRVLDPVKRLPHPFPLLLLGRDTRVAFAHLLLVLSMWGFYFSTLWLWRKLFLTIQMKKTWYWEAIIPSLALLFAYLLLCWRHGVHIYDPATLWLYSAALWALLQSKRWMYGIIFALAVWHKETAILLIAWWVVRFCQRNWLPYPTCEKEQSRQQGTVQCGFFKVSLTQERWCWIVTLLMFLFYLGVRLWVNWLYRENAGSTFEFWLVKENIPLLSSLFTHMSGRHLRLLLLLTLLIWLPARGWREKPLLFRQMMVVGLLVMGIPWLFFGILDELRALLELYPLWLVLCLRRGYSPFLGTTDTHSSGVSHTNPISMPAHLIRYERFSATHALNGQQTGVRWSPC